MRNGTAGAFAPRVLEAIGCEVIPLDCELDHTFPNYNPNTEDMKMLHAMRDAVLKHKADVALGFDGDGDRCGVVDNDGDEIFSDKVGVMLARDISKSLLLDAIPEADQANIRYLATAIAAPPKNSRTIVITRNPVKQPDSETPGYQAFVGNESKFSKKYAHCSVTIENIRQNGEPTLEITVAN